MGIFDSHPRDHVTISRRKRWKRHHLKCFFCLFFFPLKSKTRYDFILTIHVNASSIKFITLLYTKHAQAKQLGSGEPRVNQMYPANPRPFGIDSILHVHVCATIEHLASKRLLCLQNSTFLQVLAIHIECLMILTRFCHSDFACRICDAILSRS